MRYNPNIHHRRSIRLQGYDYSQAGLYFITICCQDKICRFGNIENAEMMLNDVGKMIEMEWLNLINRFPNIEFQEFITMPNHFHGILEIGNDVQPAPTNNRALSNGVTVHGKTVGDIIDAFKSITTVKYIHGVKNMDWQPFDGKIWQRNYYEHIIRDEQSYQNITNYIINNPANWNGDQFHP
jgi:REP element-mobilizing transposase RayT